MSESDSKQAFLRYLHIEILSLLSISPRLYINKVRCCRQPRQSRETPDENICRRMELHVIYMNPVIAKPKKTRGNKAPV
jgi:hypothetical protein